MAYGNLARVATPTFSSTETLEQPQGKLEHCPGYPQGSLYLQIILVCLYAWSVAGLHINLPVSLVSIKGAFCSREGCFVTHSLGLLPTVLRVSCPHCEQGLRAPAALTEDLSEVLSTHISGSSEPCVTPAPGNPTPSSRLCLQAPHLRTWPDIQTHT